MAKLTARTRETRGKNAARKLRGTGEVPAVVYGRHEEPRAVTLNLHELERLISTISVENTILDLELEGQDSVQVLIREVQYHPSRPQVLHVDLFHVHAGEPIHLNVPVRLHGTPVGVRESGGVLQEVLRELSVECLPRHIPEGIDVEIGELAIGESVYVRDISLPRVKILNDEALVICTVSAPTVAALPGDTPETEDGVSGEIEPELIRRRAEDADNVPHEHGSRAPE